MSYSWPLGDNYDSKYMDTDNFLENRRNLIDNQYYHTIQWNCSPGYVPFNYVTNYYPESGSAQEITASGAFTESGIVLNPSFQRFNFPSDYINVFNHSRMLTNTREGVRLTKLYYRINDGKWMELSPNLKNISFDLSNNGDKVEVKATYQILTMGNPHSPIPFVWLGDNDGSYNNGNNIFTDVVPVNPGRKYSGIMNINNNKDYNSDWQLQSVSWYAPGSTVLESNWTYQNAEAFKSDSYQKLGAYLNTWSGTHNCQIYDDNNMDKAPGFFNYIVSYGWKYSYVGFNTNDKTTGWWRSTYKARKSMWWVYEKTFTDTYIASGIEQQVANTTVKNTTFKVVQDDRTSIFNKGSRWLNGTNGQLLISFTGPSVAFADIYAVQKVYSEEIATKIISGKAINAGAINTIDIVFSDYPQLYRSKDIAYYIEIFTLSNGYVKYEYRPEDTSYVSVLANGVHYYNDEPSWVSNVKIKRVESDQTVSNEELYQITWDAPKDPDGENVSYTFLLDEGNIEGINFSTSEDYSLTDGIQDKWVLRVNRSSSESNTEGTIVLDTNKAMISMTDSTSALYTLSTDRLLKDSNGNYIDPLNIWIVPHDGRTNDYYYGTKINLLRTGYNPITLEAVKGSANDIATLKILHNDFVNSTVNAKVYMFMSTHPLDNSEGKYLGVLYEGPIEPGYTTKTINLQEKIREGFNIKRGHYIKYAVVCDDLDQAFDPYSSDAWDLATGYHIFPYLPTISTPFLCEDPERVFVDGRVRIAWNESINNNNDDAQIRYYIYVASINRPSMNTNSDGFWVNGEREINYEARRYYKVIDAGTALPTKDMPYILSLPEFELGDYVQIWITAKDDKKSSRYLTGYTLDVDNSGVKLNKPVINVSDVITYNLLEKPGVDGENGCVKVYQSNTLGEDATVRLYAICKKIDGANAGDMKLFDNVATWYLKSGEWSFNTKIDFRSAFGEEWSNSYVRYFAVSTTTSGASSYDANDITINAYDNWYGEHVYNEHPMPTIIKADEGLTNLHSNIYITWGYSIDEDFRDLDNIDLIEGAYDPTAPKVFC